jgi:hypothetical protein
MVQRANRAAVIDTDAATHMDLDLGARYVYRDRERVQVYLATRPYLVPILRETDPEIAKRFGAGTKVTLAVEDDVDQIGVETLWGFIRTPLPAHDARDLLRHFDREWWIARSWDVREELALDVRTG